MKASLLARLAFAGTRTDGLRVGLTAFSALLATMATLSAATVASMGFAGSDLGSDGWAQQYSSPLLREPGLRPGVVFALGALTIPILALAAQCGRIGAPARERRLAALRLAGATPGQAVLVAGGETTVAATMGVGAGLVVFLSLRAALDHPSPDGLLTWPTDVVMGPLWYVLPCAGLPLLSGLIAAGTLRRTTVGPLGIVRQSRPARPRWWPLLLIGVGVAAFGTVNLMQHNVLKHSPTILTLLLAVGALCASLGTVLGIGRVARSTGLLLKRSASPSLLIAGRRLMADPWSGSRAMAAMLVAVIVGAGALTIRSLFTTQAEIEDELYGPAFHDPFYLETMDLVNGVVLIAALIAGLALVVAFTERLASRRRAYAALVATGTPRATIAKATVWQSLIPAIPSVVIALAVGTAMMFAFGMTASAGGGESMACPNDPTMAACEDDPSLWQVTPLPRVDRIAPVPYLDLAMLGGGVLALLLITAALSLTVLRSSTDIAELRAA